MRGVFLFWSVWLLMKLVFSVKQVEGQITTEPSWCFECKPSVHCCDKGLMITTCTLLSSYSGNLKVANSIDTKFSSSCLAWEYDFPLSSKFHISTTASPIVQGFLFVMWKAKSTGHFIKVTLAPQFYLEVHATLLNSSKPIFLSLKSFGI